MSRAASDAPLSDALARAITTKGALSFSAFMTAALYDPEYGFFGTSGAGRAGAAFLTSPEVGPLFGRLVSRALDGHWDELGRPDPFVVVEAGAGRGQLAHTVLRSAPACASALRYVTVEQSAVLRAEQSERFSGGPGQPEVRADFPPPGDVGGVHVVLANELLDNLPFDVALLTERGWVEVRVDWRERFVETEAPWEADVVEVLTRDAAAAPVGTRLPIPRGFGPWLGDAVAALRPGGRLIAVDYAASTSTLIQRAGGWLRTYRAQGRGGAPLLAPGTQDITADVWIEVLERCAADAGLVPCGAPVPQAVWLRTLGLDALVAAGRTAWGSRSVTDVPALEARSREHEARALTDPAGLGSHVVFTFEKPVGTAQ